MYFLSKKQQNRFFKNFHNSGMAGRRKLGDRSLNRIFNALSIGLYYTLSFEWPDFGLKFLVTVMPKGESPTVKVNYQHDYCIG